MKGWLDQEQPEAMVEVIDYDGRTLGWLDRQDIYRLHLSPHTIEIPERFLIDPYIRYHAQLIDERDLFKDGRELNDIQVVLTASDLIKRREADVNRETRHFEESMMVNNPDMFKMYNDRKKAEAETQGDFAMVEERVPQSVEEFLAAFGAFEEETSDKEQERVEGWLSSILSDEDLDEMQDE